MVRAPEVVVVEVCVPGVKPVRFCAVVRAVPETSSSLDVSYVKSAGVVKL